MRSQAEENLDSQKSHRGTLAGFFAINAIARAKQARVKESFSHVARYRVLNLILT